MNEELKNKHSELPQERHLPWLALNEVSLLMFLDVHGSIRSQSSDLLFHAYLRPGFCR